jgi:hypothetical protein
MRMTAVGLGLAAALVLAAGPTRAGATSACLQDAKSTYVDCKSQCSDDYNDAKGVCRGVSPGCFLACVDGRKECTDAVRQPLTDCLNGCESTLDAARAQCKAQTGCGGSANPCTSNAAFIECMNAPQLAAFTCRDTCRDNFRLDPNARAALKACSAGFKACVKSCPPSSPSGAFLDQ